MARQLTAAFVRTVITPGKYGDQHGLSLRVLPTGSKQWIWRGTVRLERAWKEAEEIAAIADDPLLPKGIPRFMARHRDGRG